ncbi:MAG: 30S ribosomal protein S10 [Candidatus Terrybacteria bacterium]|nr:30S ribosomal protein S10 [Candidatus Terrybacteria bacterium]
MAKKGAKASASEAEVKARLRVKILAYDHKVIDSATRQIVETALRNSAEVHGPVPLPTEFRRYTVNRSTFVHKDAREQFEMRVHRRLVDIPSPTPKLIDALTALTLPSGVDIEIKTL